MKTSLLILVIACLFVCCSKPNPCPDAESNTVPIVVIPDSLHCKLQNTDSIKTSEGVHLIIKSEQDLAKYVFCSSGNLSVDYKTQFLVAGKIFWPKCAHISSLQLTQCPQLTLTITVDATGDGGLACGGEVVLPYFVLVKNTYSNDIKFVVNEKK